MSDVIAVYCADVGSIGRSNFGWARRQSDSPERISAEGGEEAITDFADHLAEDLAAGMRVALGFECPLFVPVPDDPAALARSRVGEGSRAWIASAGASALGCGLVESAWVLRHLRESRPDDVATTDWRAFADGHAQLFLWEAFVSGTGKAVSHAGDAEIAVDCFIKAMPDVPGQSAVTAENPLSLITTAALYAGWTFAEPHPLQGDCVVIKA
jgi:hypothetical protein